MQPSDDGDDDDRGGLHEQTSVWPGIATLPITARELSVGVYMVVKGFRPSPFTSG
jgi:hypothetical protein